jgi:hypothetical protein
MEQTITIKPIINGSFNPRLTHEQFVTLDRESKIGFLWRVLVSMEFAHSLRDVDQEVFEKGDQICDYDFLQKEDTDLDALFPEIRKAYEGHYNRMLVKTNQRRYILGQRFWHAQSECGMGGMIETDYARAQGYISAIGNWNDFNVTRVNAAISRVEDKCPRVDYGANNPNSGRKIHKWKVRPNGEYVVLVYDFADGETKERIEQFFREFESIGKGAKADSIRIEVENHGNGYFGMELYWWWD